MIYEDDDEYDAEEIPNGEKNRRIVLSWKNNMDLKALFMLSTIGQTKFDTRRFKSKWTKVVTNDTEQHIYYKNDEDYDYAFRHEMRPYALENWAGKLRRGMDQVSGFTFLYNFAWVMADLFPPESSPLRHVGGPIPPEEGFDLLLPLSFTTKPEDIYD